MITHLEMQLCALVAFMIDKLLLQWLLPWWMYPIMAVSVAIFTFIAKKHRWLNWF